MNRLFCHNIFRILLKMYIPTSERNSNYIINFGPDECLISSIILESTSTCFLKSATHNSFYYLPAYLGYIISFYLFPKSLDKYSLNFAYTLWCGIGIIFTLLYDFLFSGSIITIKKLFGIIFMVIGLYLCN